MNPMRRWKKYKVILATVGFVCTGCLCFSALASEGPTSNVWLSVTQIPSEARVSVTVPLAYGFVVRGSVDSSDTYPVSAENGNLILPNAKVHVSVPSDSGTGITAEFELQTISEHTIPILNYSTDVREEHLEEENPPREGLPVELKPFIAGYDSDEGKTHYWKTVGYDPTWDGASSQTNFKEYQMLIDNVAFSDPGQVTISYEDSSTELKDVFWYADKIALNAPEDVLTHGYTAAGTAHIPSETFVTVGVKVGGMQSEYKQVEESLKVRAIFWQVIPGELPEVTP
ncbi:hypothetical protein [Lacrimispora sp.]|uniref:hypothetical protein n=1 Tax=Lacrimispora sp. TaxID=2719234 RepID=UPI0028AFB146|nr:hypothetical protein [Lacrimispora sp.]